MLLLAQIPTEVISVVERYGSFGLIVVMFFGFIFYVIPKTIKAFEDQRVAFTDELKAERTARSEAHEKCEDSHSRIADVFSEAINKMTSAFHDLRSDVLDDRSNYQPKSSTKLPRQRGGDQ